MNRDLVSVGIAFLVRGGGAVALLALNYVIANSTTSNESGPVFWSLALLVGVGTILAFGFERLALRDISIDWDRGDILSINVYFKNAFLKVLVLASAISVFLFMVNLLMMKRGLYDPDLIFYMVLALPFYALNVFISGCFQAVKKTSWSIFSLSLGFPVVSFVAIFIFDISRPVEFGICFLAASVLPFFISLYVWIRLVGNLDGVNEFRLHDVSMPYSMWVISVMTVMVAWGGQFVSGYWLSSSDMSYLAVSQRTANLISFILIAVNLVMAPKYASIYAKGNMVALKEASNFSVKIMMAVSMPVLVFVLVFSENVMAIFGSEYSSANGLLVIFVVGQVVNVCSGSVGFLLMMCGFERDMRNIVLLSGLLSITLPALVVPVWGVEGAAWSIALCVAIQNLSAVYWVKKRLGFNTFAIWR